MTKIMTKTNARVWTATIIVVALAAALTLLASAARAADYRHQRHATQVAPIIHGSSPWMVAPPAVAPDPIAGFFLGVLSIPFIVIDGVAQAITAPFQGLTPGLDPGGQYPYSAAQYQTNPYQYQTEPYQTEPYQYQDQYRTDPSEYQTEQYRQPYHYADPFPTPAPGSLVSPPDGEIQ